MRDKQHLQRSESFAKRATRRLSSVDGWFDMRHSIYNAASSGARMMAVDEQYDLYKYEKDNSRPVSTLDLESGSGSAERNPAFRFVPYGGLPDRISGEPVGEWYQDGMQERDLGRELKDPFSNIYEVPSGERRDPFADPVTPPEPALLASSTSSPEPSIEKKREEPYHVFDKGQKWVLIIIIGIAGLFSGLSSNIYFPALDQIASDLKVTLAMVSLTITSYLIIQGISPLFWGSFSDTIGRRPIYIASFATYIVANIGLSFSPNFAVLLIFRGLQSAGSASTVSIGNGVIQDISPPSERGAFISFYQAIRNFSIAVGPVLGGLLANFFGFRSIFIFLLILSTLTTIMIIVLLPETLRSIAGNGSVPLKGIHQPLIAKVRPTRSYIRASAASDLPPRKKIGLATFTSPLKLLVQKDILLSLLFGGVVYAIWSMVTSSTTGLFKDAFALSELQLGLAFLPNGLGTIVGSTIIGKLMTSDFQSAETEYKAARGLPEDYKLPAKNVPVDFPIEHARLRRLPALTVLFVVSTAAYGFTLQEPAPFHQPGWIALPLFLQFLIAGTSNAVFALNQTLVSDLCPGKGASSTAINNLVRCSLGAVGVAGIDPLIAAVGAGPAFFGLALVTVVVAPMAVVNWYGGMGWRAERVGRKEEKNMGEKA